MRIKIYILVLATVLLLTGCSNPVSESQKPLDKPSENTLIYLYGEEHGVKKINEKEFEIWNNHYHNDNMRHLFVELPYYTAQFLNEWMKSDNDDILNELYDDLEGTAIHNENTLTFYKNIKTNCPETIFHGTDVGHQYQSIGERYIKNLTDKNLTNTDEYKLALETIEQGKKYYDSRDEVYRENTMVENFIREYDKLKNTKIMGIYGSAHTDLTGKNFYSNSIKCMANQLNDHYNGIIYSEDLSWIAKEIDPLRTDKIIVDGKSYDALYFGQQNLEGLFKDYKTRDFYRLENAYNDLSNNKKLRDSLPYNNYPMNVQQNQVFVVVYKKTDGSIEKKCYISDGDTYNGAPSTTLIRTKEISDPIE